MLHHDVSRDSTSAERTGPDATTIDVTVQVGARESGEEKDREILKKGEEIRQLNITLEAAKEDISGRREKEHGY